MLAKGFCSHISSSDKLFEAFRSLLKVSNIDSSSSMVKHRTASSRLLLSGLMATIIEMLTDLNSTEILATNLAHSSSKSCLHRVVRRYKLPAQQAR